MKSLIKKFKEWKETNCLLKVVRVEPKVGSTIIFCRLILFDEQNGSLLVYDDDRKEVIHLKLYEIDSIERANNE
ncbi:hypothetical protein [Halalkalibacter urbisdiaboli]|uniref:hypothetical protein n=1 Tax=Halalkalibacter urbisdiaboli TaxID=1960589 RepID=UPI000B436FF9|nr:hypothetical protein [Halalkalibacter urbisdiaboli]